MKTFSRFIAALLGIAVTTNMPAFADAKVEEQIVGRAVPKTKHYATSSNGVHYAVITPKGNRNVVVVDGVEGPEVDKILDRRGHEAITGEPWMVFSPDGSRHAYFTRVGNEYMVVVDGKELCRGNFTITALTYDELRFSPRGKHVWFIDFQPTGDSRGMARLVMNGKPGPPSSHQYINPVFSPDESRWAYVAKKFNGRPDEYIAVVDGKEVPFFGLDLAFTADNKLLANLAGKPPEPSTLTIDGKPAIKGVNVSTNVGPSSVGSRWAGLTHPRKPGDPVLLYIDGKEVPGAENPGKVIFSPDGKRYMAVCRTAALKKFVVIDGKRGPDYQSINAELARFTPDSSKAIYVATEGANNFVVVEGQPSEAFSSLAGQVNQIPMSEKGGRYAYIRGDGLNQTLMIDGKPLPMTDRTPGQDTLTFTADGSRYAFMAYPKGQHQKRVLFVDGAEVPGITINEIGRFPQAEEWPRFYLFSPDGKHIAYCGRRESDNKPGLFVDGKLAFAPQRSTTVHFLSWTPDSKHLVWAAQEQEGQSPPYFRVFVDGEPTVKFSEQEFIKSPGTWQMGSDGALQLLAYSGDITRRYRITPSAEMNLGTMFAEVEARQAKALAEAEAAQKNAAEAQARAAEEAAAAKQKAQEDAAAAAAKRKADYEAAVAAKKKAYEEAVAAKQKARLLQLENAKRARQGLPPLTELPE